MDGDYVDLPASELGMREKLLAQFEAAAAPGTRVLTADRFRDLVAGAGLTVGSPELDRVVLECKIDPSGSVDYSAFKASVLAVDERRDLVRRQEEAIATAEKSAGIGQQDAGGAAASRGTTFREALETATGRHSTADRSQVPAELLALPQPQRVRRLTRQISALFQEYDNGRCSLDVFRERLRQLGVDETADFRRALRMPADLTFASLFRALCSADAAPAVPAGASSARPGDPARSDLHMQVGNGRAVPSAGRRLGPPAGSRATDVVAWRGSAAQYAGKEDTQSPASVNRRARGAGGVQRGPGGARPQSAADAIRQGAPAGGPGVGRGLAASPAGSAAAPQAAAGMRVTRGGVQPLTGRYDARSMKESGAGAVIFGRGALAPGADRTGLHVAGGVTMHSSRDSKAGQRAAEVSRAVQGSSGVAASLVDDADRARDDARWESLAQASAREALQGAGPGGATAAAAPMTRAGHGLADKGLLREQVYSLVRQLDKGMLTAAGFRSRAAQMQIEIPPAVDKLLLDFEANGRADFSRYVRGFEDYLHARAAEAAATASGAPGGPAGESEAESRAREARDAAAGTAAASARGLARVQAATISHGDIVGWHGAAAESAAKEEEEAMRNRGLRPGLSRNRALWQNQAGVAIGNPVSWEQPGPRPAVDASGMRTTRKARGPAGIADRTAGNIVAWAGGAAPAAHPIASPSGQAPSPDRATALAGVSGDPGYTGGGRQGGDILPDGRSIGRGRAHVDTQLGRMAHSRGAAPFGTETDLPKQPQY